MMASYALLLDPIQKCKHGTQVGSLTYGVMLSEAHAVFPWGPDLGHLSINPKANWVLKISISITNMTNSVQVIRMP